MPCREHGAHTIIISGLDSCATDTAAWLAKQLQRHGVPAVISDHQSASVKGDINPRDADFEALCVELARCLDDYTVTTATEEPQDGDEPAF
jgi:transposase